MSIQSTVVYGHVGSTAAALPLHRLGFDVWALPTVVYSSHAGYPGVRGRRTPVSELRELLAGLEALGRLDRCEAVLSGYLGQPGDLERRARGARRRAEGSAPTPGTSAIRCSETRASCTSRPSSCARSARRPCRGRSARPQPLRAGVARRPAGAHRGRGRRSGGRAARSRGARGRRQGARARPRGTSDPARRRTRRRRRVACARPAHRPVLERLGRRLHRPSSPACASPGRRSTRRSRAGRR